MADFFQNLMQMLALPQYGLSTVFVVAFLSATLLPLGSEAAVYGLLVLNPQLFWPTMVVATIGNTMGGAVSWWMGLGAHKAVEKVRKDKTESTALAWLQRFGPGHASCLFCLRWATLCVLWQAGSKCLSGPAWAGWLWANACAMWC